MGADRQRRHRQGLAGERETGRRRRPRRRALRRRARPSALGLRAAERRRARRRDQCAAEAGRREGHQGRRHEAADEKGGCRGSERESHYAAARRGWRRRRGAPLGPPRGSQFAVRHGAGRQSAVRRRHRRAAELSLWRRSDAHRRERDAHRDSSRRSAQPSLDQERHREPGRQEALRDGGLQQQRRRARHRRGGRPRRHLGNRRRARQLTHLRVGPPQSERHGVGTRHRRAVDGGQRARRARQRPRPRLHDLGARRRLLRLAVQLLRPARRRPRASRSAPISSRPRSFRTTRWGRTRHRSALPRRAARACPIVSSTACSSASTVRGTASHAAATR